MTIAQQKTQLLVFPVPGETYEQAFTRGLADLKSCLPLLSDDWERIKIMSQDDYTFPEALRTFYEDFFYCWSMSSPKTLTHLGAADCETILELTSRWKSVVWSIDALLYYEELPEELTIFRGGQGSLEEVTAGYSWSLSCDISQTYIKDSNGLLISAQLKKSDILLLAPEENEIVPKRNALVNVQVSS